MDGTIYRGRTLFDFTVPFLRELDRLGIGYTFLTNNSSKSTDAYIEHLRNMGISCGPSQVFTSADSTIIYLQEVYPACRKLFVLGTDSLAAHLQQNGYLLSGDTESPELVVVGFHTSLPYDRLCKACWWISQGIPYVATHPDRVCPTDQPTILVDCGAVCAAIESATSVAPTAVLGKPDPRMLRGILDKHMLQPYELAMVGDRIYTDVAMAQQSGALGVLVLTGEATASEASSAKIQADLVVPSLTEFGEMLAHAQSAADTLPS